MIPPFEPATGNLPPGLHPTAWNELVARFGHTERRRELLDGLLEAARLLRQAGCQRLYLDGSFVTDKEVPGDYDGCWDSTGVDVTRIDRRPLTFDAGRATQKAAFRGELFIASSRATPQGTLFIDFFQRDRDGRPKGIIVLELETLP
jgi:hypothetical protein